MFMALGIGIKYFKFQYLKGFELLYMFTLDPSNNFFHLYYQRCLIRYNDVQSLPDKFAGGGTFR